MTPNSRASRSGGMCSYGGIAQSGIDTVQQEGKSLSIFHGSSKGGGKG